MTASLASETHTAPGPLLIIGGAEDHKGECRILREFVRLAGGESARLVVIATGSLMPAEVGGRYIEVFGRLGAGHVKVLDIDRRGDANSRAAINAIERATGVFFTGGNQERITRLLGGTKVDTFLHRRHEAGLVLGGTSAGAAMMSTVMISGSKDEAAYRVGIVKLNPGMEFLRGVLIDQHFEERGRLRRLLSAVAQYPHKIGLGIDEDTALLVIGQTFEVIGQGSVTVIDAGDITYTNLTTLEKDDILKLYGVKIHILADGCRFDLSNRVPIIEGETAEAGKVAVG